MPIFGAPDENYHYWVIDFLSHHLRCPDAHEVTAGGLMAVYGSMAQMGYLPHAVMNKLFELCHPFLFARFGSLLMGLVTTFAGYRIGKELFADRRLLSFSLPAMLVFHPQLVFVNSYSNSDSTTCAVASLIFYLLILSIKYGHTFKRSAAMGLLLGWLVLCKYSGYVLLPVVLIGLISASWLHATSMAATCCYIGLTASIALGLSTPWFVRNYFEFNGDVLGTRTMYLTWASTFHKSLNYYLNPWKIVTTPRWWRMFYYSFWGVFGYMNRYLWNPVYSLFTAYLLAGTAGWCKALFSATGSSPAVKSTAPRDFKNALITIRLLMLFCCVSNVVEMIWASTSNLGGPQGRYFFASEIPFMVLLLEGLWRLGPKTGSFAVLSLLFINATTCVGAWFMLLLIYGFGRI